ncbi:MAG: dihydroorotase [Crocinitomicaceae bacterium]|jgi:dihydroorotase|nr:dihydroorotase [Crocinitomicaceae bacterium]
MSTILIKNATLVNEGRQVISDLLIKDGIIAKIGPYLQAEGQVQEIDAEGLYLLPGCIDDQVHFREPGLTHKANIHTESCAAVAGGITSFMEMPNTVPNTLTQALLQDKYDIAANSSVANYSFFMGASNDNIEEVLKTDREQVCGIKVFMGSSTGNMLVDNEQTLENLFSRVSPMLIATHCEDEATIRKNLEAAKAQYGENIPVEMHPVIRNEEACYLSSSMAVNLAKKHGTRLHILHISTAKELELFDNTIPLESKLITAEACVHHLWFSDKDYASKGNFIKWNPAVKSEQDREAIWQAVLDKRIDVIATDHAPHTLEEKSQGYLQAPSGGPLVQHALLAMLEKVRQGVFSIEGLVEKMTHAPAVCFKVKQRGYIREGYFADLVLVDPNTKTEVTRSSIFSKCGWSPFEGTTFSHAVSKTFVNGAIVYENNKVNTECRGSRLSFNR